MCMRVKSIFHRIPRWTLKPRTVYKVFESRTDGLFTPYQNYKFNQVGVNRVSKIGFDGKLVHEGIHSFTKLPDAKSLAYEFNHDIDYFTGRKRHYNLYVVAECEIPRFTRYHTGIWHNNNNIPNIVSTAVRFKKIIATWS